MLEVTADETRLRMALCNMLLNCVNAVVLLEEAEVLFSVKWFCAVAWLSNTGPFNGLPPNDGLMGVYASSLAPAERLARKVIAIKIEDLRNIESLSKFVTPHVRVAKKLCQLIIQNGPVDLTGRIRANGGDQGAVRWQERLEQTSVAVIHKYLAA